MGIPDILIIPIMIFLIIWILKWKFQELRKLRVYPDKIAVGRHLVRYLFEIIIVERSMSKTFPKRIGHETVMPLQDVDKISVGCHYDDSRSGFWYDVSIKRFSNYVFTGVIRKPLKFLRAFEKTEIADTFHDILDISSIATHLKTDPHFKEVLTKSKTGADLSKNEQEFIDVIFHIYGNNYWKIKKLISGVVEDNDVGKV